MQNVRGLGLLAPEELFSRRQVEEQRTHFHRCSWSAAAVGDRLDFSSRDLDFRARRSLGRTRYQTKPRNARNAWHGLPPESHRFNISQILGCADFARGMPFQTEQCVLAVHPGTVVLDPNKLGSSSRKFHADPARTGINAVLDEFLDHRSRAFHDFACRDLACNFVREQADLSHVV